MIFLCNHCRSEMRALRTKGDEVNDSLICPECSEALEKTLKKAREIQSYLMAHFKRLP